MSSKVKCIFCCAQIYDTLGSFENSDEVNDLYRGGKTNLRNLCRILKIPRTSFSTDEFTDFEALVCFTCDSYIRRIREFLQELKNVRNNLYSLRKNLFDEMFKTTVSQESVKTESKNILHQDSEFLKIRKIVFKDLSNTITVDDLKEKHDELVGDFDPCDGNATPPRLDDISEGLPLPSPSQSFTSELMPTSPPKIMAKTKISKRVKKTELGSQSLNLNPCFEVSISSQISLGATYPGLKQKLKKKGKKQEYQLYQNSYNTGDSSDEEKRTVHIKSVPDPTWASAQGSFGLDFDSSQSQTLDSLPDGQHYSQSSRNRKMLPANFSKQEEKQSKKDALKSSVRQIEIHVIGADGKSLESIQTVGVVEDDVPQTLTVEGILEENLSVVSFDSQVYEKCFPCNHKDCDKVFPNEDKKNFHFKKVHSGLSLPYQCGRCNKSFKSSRILKSHVLKRCANSTAAISEGQNRNKKPKRVNLKNHKCEHCSEKFRNPGELIIHTRRVHTGETPFVCNQNGCDKSFVSALRLEFHIEQDHNEIAPLKCEFCGKGFFREHRLRDHRKAHTGEKSYLCEICSKSFTQPAYLRYHQTQHDELNFQPYKCDKCNKRFASPANLKLHVTTQHEKFYRYRCDICNHGSTHMSHLKLHMRSHTGERPFQCQVCSKGFMRGAQLNIHLRSHTGDRPYKCGTCDKGFTNSSKLRRHELLHKDEKPFQCDLCEKSYTTRSYLKSHQKAAHRTKISDLLEAIHATSQADHKQHVYVKHIDDPPELMLHNSQQSLFDDDVETTVQYGEFILL